MGVSLGAVQPQKILKKTQILRGRGHRILRNQNRSKLSGEWSGVVDGGTALGVAAVQAEVVAVYDAARAATVYPALVAANRDELVALMVSNLLGQNAPAIAAIEAAV